MQAPTFYNVDAEELGHAVDQPRPDGVRAAQRLHRHRHRHGARRRAVQHGAVGRHPLRGLAPGLPAYSPANNDLYQQMEDQDADLRDRRAGEPHAVGANGMPAAATAGVMTTRAAAQAFFVAGTNRAMFRFTMINHMCRTWSRCTTPAGRRTASART